MYQVFHRSGEEFLRRKVFDMVFSRNQCQEIELELIIVIFMCDVGFHHLLHRKTYSVSVFIEI